MVQFSMKKSQFGNQTSLDYIDFGFDIVRIKYEQAEDTMATKNVEATIV